MCKARRERNILDSQDTVGSVPQCQTEYKIQRKLLAQDNTLTLLGYCLAICVYQQLPGLWILNPLGDTIV